MKHIKWLGQHPWTVVSFGSGVLVGILFCLPLVPFELPDSAASLIGSLVGALVAIGGAVWVAGIPERKKLRAFQAQLMEQSLSVTFSLNDIEIKAPSCPVNTDHISTMIQDSCSACAQALQKLTLLEARAVESGVEAMAMRRMVMRAIEKVEEDLIASTKSNSLLPVGYSKVAKKIRETLDGDIATAFSLV